MDKLKFKTFTWPENPEEYKISASCAPKFVSEDPGRLTFAGLEPLSRVITGRGVFHGVNAARYFTALADIMASRTQGLLVHPTWGNSQAFLTDLTMEQESRPEYIVYTFQFREADENGAIPWLPKLDGDQGNS